MHQESSWITKCSTPATWSFTLFVCPLLLQWLFQRFPLTAAAKQARLKVTDWDYRFKYMYKCIDRFPFLLCFFLLLTDVKITHLPFKPHHTLLFCKIVKILLTFIPSLSQNFSNIISLTSVWQGTLIKLVILFFDQILVIPEKYFLHHTIPM